MEVTDISHWKRVHFVGIKGIAMAALASVLTTKGIEVTGSDAPGHFPSDDILEKIQVHVWDSFAADHIAHAKPDAVIYTGAHHGVDNPEVQKALSEGIPVFPHGKALGMVMAEKKRISVAGCHGKTTTSAMVATILSLSDLDPSYTVGCGWIFPIGTPGRSGNGGWFVAEADEYVTDPGHDKTPRFLWQKPDICCITNIDFDHPDVYDTIDDVKKAYQKLVDTVGSSGFVVCNGDDAMSAYLEIHATRIRVGRDASNEYRIVNETVAVEHNSFDLVCPDASVIHIVLQVPGVHNVTNAAQAAVVGLLAGCTKEQVSQALSAFTGTRRRFEKVKEAKGIVYYDDYAHHPHELEATLAAAKAWYPNRRIIAVFEPHTYSRTKALLDEFGHALSKADIAVVSAIYASARENDTLHITGNDVVSAIARYSSHAVYKETPEQIIEYLKGMVQTGDVVLFMGAGDVFLWSRSVIQTLSV